MKRLWEMIKSPGAMAIVAIASLAFTFFQEFHDKSASILVKTETVSSVFNVFQPVGGLEISYAGQDLRSSKQALWVITAEISNNGAVGIRKADYDESAPLTISVKGGRIVETPAIESENEYLRDNLRFKIVDNRVVFTPVILEPKDSFRINLLVLGAEGSVPTLRASAKISGLRNIGYSTPDAPNSDKSIWRMITDAEAWWVHLLRFPVYTLGGLIGLIAFSILTIASIVAPIEKFQSWRQKQQRSRQIRDYRLGEDLDWVNRALTDIYLEHGEKALARIKNMIDISKKRIELINDISSLGVGTRLDNLIKRATPFVYLDLIKERKLLSFSGINPEWADGVEQSLIALCQHLSINLDAICNELDAHDDNLFYSSLKSEIAVNTQSNA